MEHPIWRFCRKHNLNLIQFAQRMDLSASYVRQIVCGQYLPGRVAASRMVERSGGELDLVELLTWRKPARESAA